MEATENTIDESVRTHSSRAARNVGVLSAVATFAFLIPGAGRGYDMDSGLTVGLFVATGSIWDAFNKAYLVTNQVFFSFLDHLVYSATDSRSEVVLRLLPIAITAVAVGLVAKYLTAGFGVAPGLAGAAVLATNPLFAVEGTQIRGYGLVVLCTIVTTLLFLRALETDHMSNAAKVGYAVVGAIGVATHLYMLVVLGIHAVMSLISRRQFERIALAWLTALLGITAYIRIAHQMQSVVDAAGRSFQATFPRDLAVELLGGGVAAAIVTLAIIAPVAWNSRNSRLVQLAGVGVVGAVIAVWVMAPRFLYPRFFLWLSPIVAVAVAVAVAKRPILLALVLALVGLQVHTAWPRLTTDLFPNQKAARIFKTVREHGGTVCATDVYTGLRLIGSTHPFFVLPSIQKGGCTVAVRFGTPAPGLERSFDRLFPYHMRLTAQTPGEIWSTRPLTCWTSHPQPPGCAI